MMDIDKKITLPQFLEIANNVKQKFSDASFSDEDLEAKRNDTLQFVEGLLSGMHLNATGTPEELLNLKKQLAEFLYFQYQNN